MLNPSRLRSLLSTRYCGHHLLQFGQIDSTNRLLTEWAQRQLACKQPLPAGTTAIATRQSGGRGQRGHQWLSAPGGLYASVLFYPNIQAQQLLELTLAVAWGIAVHLRESQSLDIRLKWPNDLMLNDRKLGGVLLQAQLQGDRVRSLVAGVGLNGYNPTPEVGIALSEMISESSLDLAAVTADVLSGIERGYESWHTHGLLGLTPSYQSLMLHRDRCIPLADRHNGEGTVIGINASGQLEVDVLGDISTFQPGQIQLGYETIG